MSWGGFPGRGRAPAARRPSARRALRRAGGLAAAAVAVACATGAGWPSAAAAPHRDVPAGRNLEAPGAAGGRVPLPGERTAAVAPLRQLRQPGLMIVSPGPLPRGTLAAVRKLPGVRAALAVDAARIRIGGKYVAVLGVDPSKFRAFADPPTARHTALWRAVAAGDLAISYTMGRLDKLPVGTSVSAVGQRQESLLVGGIGTVGIAGVDGVVSGTVARSLGFPAGNALVISVTPSRVSKLAAHLRSVVPHTAAVEQLIIPGPRATSGTAGVVTAAAGSTGSLLSSAQVTAFLRAALSRVGMPYVWGAAGPRAFDCSGLVQWSLARAGVIMPRVAADQARTGPAVPVSRLQAGDLLFYHTDPTAPTYISHVAIYLGSGRMLQAPQPGMNVEIVPVDLGGDFAGAVAVSPRTAAAAAAAPVG